MDHEQFWQLITGLRRDSHGDISAMKRALANLLPELSDPDLAALADRWNEISDQADSWGLAEATTVAFGYLSDDSMRDVRNWLICQGPEAFGRVLGNPDCLLDYLSPAGSEDFSAAEEFPSDLLDALDQRPLAASMRTHQATLRQRTGDRTDLTDPEAVRSKYPRCAAAREAAMAKPLPSFFVSLKDQDDAPRRKPTLSLNTAWVSRRQ